MQVEIIKEKAYLQIYFVPLFEKFTHWKRGSDSFSFWSKSHRLTMYTSFWKSYFSFVKPVQCGPSQGSHSHAHVVATEPGKVWCSSCRASPALGCFLCSVSGTFLVPHHSHVSLWHFRSCSQFSCAVGFIAHQLCTLVVSTSCAHHHIFIVLCRAQCAKALWCIFYGGSSTSSKLSWCTSITSFSCTVCFIGHQPTPRPFSNTMNQGIVLVLRWSTMVLW